MRQRGIKTELSVRNWIQVMLLGFDLAIGLHLELDLVFGLGQGFDVSTPIAALS